MTSSPSKVVRQRSVVIWIGLAVIVGIFVVGYLTRDRWRPIVAAAMGHSAASKPDENAKDSHSQKDGHNHDHGHDHGSGETADMVSISEQARKNLGLKVGAVEPQDFWKRIVVPGQVANLPGHSERRINATVQGTILKVYVVQGQTVHPGDSLFEMQVTSELLASAQSNLLRTLQDIEVNEAEIKRLAPLGNSGAVAPKLLLEKQYEQRRLESTRQVQLQELTVRGLSPAQVRTIIDEKKLIRHFTVKVPSPAAPIEEAKDSPAGELGQKSETVRLAAAQVDDANEEMPTFVIEQMDVFPGKLVNPGDELCDLAKHSHLQIRGEAFETESAQIYRALTERWPLSAVFELGDREPLVRDKLNILYASSVTDPMDRSFEFFVPLVNDVIRDQKGADGRNYCSWRFKPGQQVQLLVPVEKWTERFVIPSEAVVSEGAESFVFKTNGKLLQRQAVVIEYRDARQTVIANDGSIFPGDEIAMNQAYSLNLALKKASGSGVDLHAGHNH